MTICFFTVILSSVLIYILCIRQLGDSDNRRPCFWLNIFLTSLILNIGIYIEQPESYSIRIYWDVKTLEVLALLIISSLLVIELSPTKIQRLLRRHGSENATDDNQILNREKRFDMIMGVYSMMVIIMTFIITLAKDITGYYNIELVLASFYDLIVILLLIIIPISLRQLRYYMYNTSMDMQWSYDESLINTNKIRKSIRKKIYKL